MCLKFQLTSDATSAIVAFHGQRLVLSRGGPATTSLISSIGHGRRRVQPELTTRVNSIVS